MQNKIQDRPEKSKPGPKPKAHPLLPRSLRTTDAQWATYKKQGGDKWFRGFLDGLGKVPKK
jgi:hypothetical protein